MARRKHKRKLHIEQLENRQLFAADLVGVVRSNQWLLDTNRNSVHEIDLSYGLAGDAYVAGKWDNAVTHPGVVRGGNPDGLLRWYLDTDGDPGHELTFAYGLNGDKPVVGNWDGIGFDNIGVVRTGTDGLLRWYLDTDGDSTHEIDYVFGLAGDTPIAGDFNGDGKDDVAVVRGGYADGLLRTFINYDSDQVHEDVYVFGRTGDRPVVGDFNNDGRDDLAMVRSNMPDGLLHWYINYDKTPEHEAEQVFGINGDVPVVGDWKYAEVAVLNQNNQPIASYDFGRRLIGSASPTLTLKIANTGNDVLKLGNLQLPAGFTLVGSVGDLQPNGVTTISIQLQTGAKGLFEGALTIATNDGNENPLSFPLRAIVYEPAPEIDLVSNGTPVNRFATVDFGNVPVGSLPVRRSFVIENNGTADLHITGVATPTGFQLVQAPATLIPPGGKTVMVVEMNTSVVGPRLGEIIVTNNDSNEASYRFTVKGNVNRGPEITVFQGSTTGTLLTDGLSRVDFGTVKVANIKEITITIRDDGESNLTLSRVTIGGNFTIVGQPSVYPAVIAPGRTATIRVRLNYSTVGTFDGELALFTNDADESQFNIPLVGRVVR